MLLVSYPLVADVDTGSNPRVAPRYYARPAAKRGVAVLTH